MDPAPSHARPVATRGGVAYRQGASRRAVQRATVAEAAGPTLKDVVVFDIFTDSRIGSGQKSVALGLILQETSRTLTDADIEKIISGVVTHLAMKFGARLRE